MLTFELKDGDEIEIHGDEDGLRRLLEAVRRVLETGEHDHLMTPAWGGAELSQEKQGPRNRLLNKVSIRRWD